MNQCGGSGSPSTSRPGPKVGTPLYYLYIFFLFVFISRRHDHYCTGIVLLHWYYIYVEYYCLFIDRRRDIVPRPPSLLGGLRPDGLDFAYWQLGGTQVGGTSRRKGEEETYGVMNQCWTAPVSTDHLSAIMALKGGGKGGGGGGETSGKTTKTSGAGGV